VRKATAELQVTEGSNAGNTSPSTESANRAGKLILLPPLLEDGEPVSSSRIRALLLAGDAEGACRLLGREYSLSGARKAGDGIASRLGYPTLNLSEVATLIPGNGVYAARLEHAGKLFPAMCYIGTRPTHTSAGLVSGREKRIEAHVLDSSIEFKSGEEAEIHFVRRIRDEMRFSGEKDLLRQLAQDAEAVRYCASRLR
jgi:riboflavin kinase/FMN adenylyltransferase